jgi:hypothetical protein
MFRAFCGWLAGCGVATVVIVVLPGALFMHPRASLFHPASSLSMLLNPLLLVFAVTCAMTAFPAMFLISLSIDLQARSPVFYSLAGSVLGALCISLLVRSFAIWFWVGPLFVVAGLAAGVTYWLIAGKHAICDRSV